MLVVAAISPTIYILSLGHMDKVKILLYAQWQYLLTGVVPPLLPSE